MSAGSADASREGASVAILLSTYNGSRYLGAQLDSFLVQTHTAWVLHWRDDGSDDATVAIMTEFAAGPGAGRCVHHAEPEGRLGPTASFLSLLRDVAPGLAAGDAIAFADQDDVWLPEKLARGRDGLAGLPAGVAGLYCARQVLVDAALRPIGLSPACARAPGFPAALTQNIATGCTVLLNRAGARLVAASRPSAGALHDWWCYLIIAASGGRVVADDHPVILYRQHGRNMVGAPRSRPRRAIAAMRRGAGAFMALLRANVAALAAQPELLSAEARADVQVLRAALDGGVWRRLAALRMAGLARQTRMETWLFRLWFLLG